MSYALLTFKLYLEKRVFEIQEQLSNSAMDITPPFKPDADNAIEFSALDLFWEQPLVQWCAAPSFPPLADLWGPPAYCRIWGDIWNPKLYSCI